MAARAHFSAHRGRWSSAGGRPLRAGCWRGSGEWAALGTWSRLGSHARGEHRTQGAPHQGHHVQTREPRPRLGSAGEGVLHSPIAMASAVHDGRGRVWRFIWAESSTAMGLEYRPRGAPYATTAHRTAVQLRLRGSHGRGFVQRRQRICAQYGLAANREPAAPPWGARREPNTHMLFAQCASSTLVCFSPFPGLHRTARR